MVTDYMAGRLIRLRALEPADEPLLTAWDNDAVVTEFLTPRHPSAHYPAVLPGGMLVASIGEAARFGVTVIDEGVLIGHVSLYSSRPENNCASLEIVIGDRRYWDRGYGTDALRVICRFGFEMMNLHRIELEVFAENLRAIRIYDRAGFQREGLRRQAIYKSGRYHDIIGMGLLRGEFR